MPSTLAAAPDTIHVDAGAEIFTRRCVWFTAIAGSRLPEILFHELGWKAGFVLPIGQTIFLVVVAIFFARRQQRTDLAGFALTVAALLFAWSVAAPWIDRCAVVQHLSQNLSWSGRFYLSRVIRVVGAVLVSATFLGAGIGRRDLFLQRGNWKVPVQDARFIHRGISWFGLAVTLGPLFSIIVGIYLVATMPVDFGRFSALPLLLLSCLPVALLNATNEEFQFRSALLARLTSIVSPREAAILCGVIFGIGHYFGRPGGWGGALITGFGGWVCARSMLETRGFTWAWATHFMQDILIFAFVALSAAA